jgi:hypothetical protein
VSGQWFSIEPDIQASYVFTGKIDGSWFKVELSHNKVIGAWFKVEPLITTEFNAEYAQAYVMNMTNQAVTRYTNYPFIHLAKIGNDYYGFKADGIYKITGSLDVSTDVIGSITTKETDFGVMQSKNVAAVYADTDAKIDVTPIVDGTASIKHSAIFNGRKIKLGRGTTGRYWAFRIDKITELNTLEYLPEQSQRRVK